MASSYTSRLRLEKQADGENPNTWGQIVNRVFETIEQSIAGVQEIALAGTDVTLTTSNGDIDQARNMMLKCSGALSADVAVIIPPVSKVYIVFNDTTLDQTLTIKTAAGVGAVIPQGTVQLVACDGTDCKTLADVAEAENALQLGGVAAATYARKDQGLPTDQVFTKAQGTTKVALSISGGTVAVDASLSNSFGLTLTGNATLSNPTGDPVDGQTIRIVVRQDATGGRTLAYGSKYKFPAGIVPTATATANAVDYLAFEYVAALDVWIGNMMQDLK
jgi:hypothetical protein